MRVHETTIKRGNSYETQYRIDDVYVDLYTSVASLIDELRAIVELFPEELRALVLIDMDYDTHYATFTVEGPASAEATALAKAKDKRDKEQWLARAVKERARLDSQIEEISKEVA